MTDRLKDLADAGVSIWLDDLSRERLTQLVRKNFDLTPYGLREMLDLVRPIYQKTAAYGHFGRTEAEFTWEKTDRAAALASEGKTVRAA